MTNLERRTITLPVEQASDVDTLVATGGYASASEVIRTALRALKERDALVERWLRQEVAPVFDRMQAAPLRAIPAKDVFAALRKRHKQSVSKKRRGVKVAFSPEAVRDLLSPGPSLAVPVPSKKLQIAALNRDSETSAALTDIAF